MPQDTTIYWDARSTMPEPIAQLPAAVRTEVLEKILARRKELEYSDPTWIYISIAAVIILFSFAAIRSNRKMKRTTRGY